MDFSKGFSASLKAQCDSQLEWSKRSNYLHKFNLGLPSSVTEYIKSNAAEKSCLTIFIVDFFHSDMQINIQYTVTVFLLRKITGESFIYTSVQSPQYISLPITTAPNLLVFVNKKITPTNLWQTLPIYFGKFTIRFFYHYWQEHQKISSLVWLVPTNVHRNF